MVAKATELPTIDDGKTFILIEVLQPRSRTTKQCRNLSLIEAALFRGRGEFARHVCAGKPC